jgi:predicted dehydrogenase
VGYDSVETDWRRLMARDDIDLVDVRVPNRMHKEIALAAATASNGSPARSRSP